MIFLELHLGILHWFDLGFLQELLLVFLQEYLLDLPQIADPSVIPTEAHCNVLQHVPNRNPQELLNKIHAGLKTSMSFL